MTILYIWYVQSNQLLFVYTLAGLHACDLFLEPMQLPAWGKNEHLVCQTSKWGGTSSSSRSSCGEPVSCSLSQLSCFWFIYVYVVLCQQSWEKHRHSTKNNPLLCDHRRWERFVLIPTFRAPTRNSLLLMHFVVLKKLSGRSKAWHS